MPFLLTDDINVLILQYLRESGFSHSSFTFAHESGIDSCTNISSDSCSKLVELIQKGIYFTEIELLADKLTDQQPNHHQDSSLNDNVEILNKVIGEIHSKIKKNGIFDDFENDLLPPIPEYLQKNGVNLPNFCSLNPDCISMLSSSFGRINHFSWGPSCAIVTGHISGTCVNWIIDKKGAEKPGSTSFKIRYFVETPGTQSKNEIIRVEHIPFTENYCCGTNSGVVQVFNDQGLKNTYQDFHTSVWASSAWIDPRRLNDPYVAFSSVDGTCALRHGVFLQNVRCIQSFADCISESSWSSSGSLALSSLDGSISFLNPLTDSPPAAVNLHKGEIYDHEWSRINEYLAVVSYSNLTIYYKPNIDQPYEITCHKCEIAAIKWISGNEDILLSVDVNSNLFFHIFDRNQDKWKSSYLFLHSLPVKCMEIVPNCPTYVVIGSQDGHLLIVDCKDKKIFKSFRLPYEITCIKSNDSGFMAIQFSTGQVSIISISQIL